VEPLTLRSGSTTCSCSYSAIELTAFPSLSSPLAPLLPLLLMLTPLFALSGPLAMLLHVLLC
ncbi:unnamed protein product, partial [Closterium sp. NIES-53]